MIAIPYVGTCIFAMQNVIFSSDCLYDVLTRIPLLIDILVLDA